MSASLGRPEETRRYWLHVAYWGQTGTPRHAALMSASGHKRK